MHDVTRQRIIRKLERLPEAQLYQVLDFVEFLDARHGQGAEPRVTGFQRFAERLEDRMRARSIAGTAMTGTLKVVGTASKVLDGISTALQTPILPPAETPRPEARSRPAAQPPVRTEGGVAAPAESAAPEAAPTSPEERADRAS